jgi:exodeoxyribonuclease-3
MLVACLYLPNGDPQPGPKFAYKLAWLGRLIRHAQALLKSGHPVISAGDFNMVSADFDIYNPKSWRKDALLQPESWEGYARLLAQGWTDALKVTHPAEAVFTFWDYFRNHWQRNVGLRIDHVLLSPNVASRLTAAGVDSWVRGQPHASEHAPVRVQLSAACRRTAPKRSRVRKKTSAKRAGAAPSTKST